MPVGSKLSLTWTAQSMAALALLFPSEQPGGAPGFPGWHWGLAPIFWAVLAWWAALSQLGGDWAGSELGVGKESCCPSWPSSCLLATWRSGPVPISMGQKKLSWLPDLPFGTSGRGSSLIPPRLFNYEYCQCTGIASEEAMVKIRKYKVWEENINWMRGRMMMTEWLWQWEDSSPTNK